MVEHGDGECRFCSCHGGMGLFCEAAGPGRLVARTQCPPLPRADGQILNTEFGPGDAVFGDEGKLLDALRAAAVRSGPGGYVECYVCCSPLMLATDTAELAARACDPPEVGPPHGTYVADLIDGFARGLARPAPRS